MKKLFIVFSMLIGIFSQSFAMTKTEIIESKKISEIFEKEKVKGTFIVYDMKNHRYTYHNLDRAMEEFYPASTFKIFNSLIGVETGAVENVDEVFYKYNGEKVFLESWAQDSNLRYAIKVSQVPAYKELAKRIGLEKMQENIKKLGYGNMEIGTEIDKFWLEGPLKISAAEQVDLLNKLAQKKLPFSDKAQEQIIDITTLEKTDNYTLHGKTGWATSNIKIPVGWFVGWVETEDNIYSFAINIDNPTGDLLPKRESIAKEALKELGVLK